jgi:hypothetical protein
MEEQSALLRTISHQLENLNKAIPELQAKVSKAGTDISSLSNAQSSLVNRMFAKPDPFATANAIQVRIDENVVLIMVNNNLVPVDFLVMDVECNASCHIILGRPFLRTVGAIIDMREGTIKYQFPLQKGMEHFPRKRKKLLFDSILRANYELDASSLDIT